jgi:integrase
MRLGQLMAQAGLLRRGRSCHALRRTFASSYLRAHKDRLLPLSRLLRHENVATTAKYVFLDLDDLREGLDDLRL